MACTKLIEASNKFPIIVYLFLLYGRRIATHSVDPSLTHFLVECPGLGLALVPDVVVPEAEQWCAWSRKLDLNFCPGGVEPRTLASSGRGCCHYTTAHPFF